MQRDLLLLGEMIDAAEQAQRDVLTLPESVHAGDFKVELSCG